MLLINSTGIILASARLVVEKCLHPKVSSTINYIDIAYWLQCLCFYFILVYYKVKFTHSILRHMEYTANEKEGVIE
jgi:hypothetical protein